jgi:hypothetical protein
MIYRKKVVILSAIAAFLASLYVMLVIFSPDRTAARNTLYTWLDPKTVSQTGRIQIDGEAAPVILVQENGAWFVDYGGERFPAKNERAGELLELLSARGSFPVRANAASAHERLGVGDDSPRRIALWRGGAESAPFFELIAGNYDAAGLEVYYRRAGFDEVRSGSAELLRFANYGRTAWYDLRLFPEEIAINDVNRVTVTPPGRESRQALTAERAAAGWQIDGLARDRTDVSRIEPWIRGILSAEGDDYVSAEGDLFSAGRIVMETGSGTWYVRLGEEILPAAEGQSARRRAKISPSERVVSLPSWTVDRLFRDRAYFSVAAE